MKRPLSTWFTLSLLILTGVLALPGILFWTVKSLAFLSGSSKSPFAVLFFYAEFAIRSALFAFLVYAIVAILRRSRHSRRLGLMALLLVFFLVVLSKIAATPGAGELPKFQLNTPEEQAGAHLANIVEFVGFWILWFRFGFSKRSRQYFDHAHLPLDSTTDQPGV